MSVVRLLLSESEALEMKGKGSGVRSKTVCSTPVLRVLIGLTVVLAAGLSVASVPQRPSWNLMVLGGGRLALADLRGYIVVAAFGATWCPPCRSQLPLLQSLANRYQSQNVKVVWISVDDQQVTDRELTQYVNNLGVTFSVLRDVGGTALAQLRQSSLPLLIVIDRQGHLVGEPYVGFSDQRAFSRKVAQLIDSARGSRSGGKR